MCGRFTLAEELDRVRQEFRVESGAPMEYRRRYNIAPTQEVPAIVGGNGRFLKAMRWGLIPGWAKDANIASKLINARSETAAEKPSFREAIRHRRCLIPSDGFYEWRAGERTAPYHIRRADGKLFAFAAIWETWKSPTGQSLDTFAILTVPANDLLRPLHERMPVILYPEDYDRWLDPAITDPAAIADLLKPLPNEVMVIHPVSLHVNKVSSDDESCRELVPEVAPARGLFD